MYGIYRSETLIYIIKIPSFVLQSSKLKKMKYFNIILLILWIFASCKDTKPQNSGSDSVTAPPDFAAVGAPVTEGEVLDQEKIAVAYGALNPGDTLHTRFEGEVLAVCQNKGCWMRIGLPEGKDVMVRFKDYGFFVPKDIAGSRVQVEGKAFVSEVPEEERRHLAEDAGTPDSLIAKIKGADLQLGFEASGVRIF
jgi:hypothetical protein